MATRVRAEIADIARVDVAHRQHDEHVGGAEPSIGHRPLADARAEPEITLDERRQGRQSAPSGDFVAGRMPNIERSVGQGGGAPLGGRERVLPQKAQRRFERGGIERVEAGATEQDVDAVVRLLAATRLLTLTGAPGVGKTRLALEVAGGLVSTFPDGVWMVELAPVADPALVSQAIATVLDVREQPHRSVPDTLADAVRARRLLLVLDNCEHLVDACAHLADGLLRTCPGLVIVATSREPLGVAGETIYRVPSLHDESAVALFTERVQRVSPAFVLDATTRGRAAKRASVA